MAFLTLTNGSQVEVEDDDFEHVEQWVWYPHPDGYAQRGIQVEKQLVMNLLHREIMGAKEGELVDHRDRNMSRCVRRNLRIVTHRQNLMNRSPNKRSSSGYRGVSWNPQREKWAVRVILDKRVFFFGYYDDPEEAAYVWDQCALQLYGAYAYRNLL